MTREEAKEKLYMEWQKFLENNIDYAGISEAYKMAFKALEEQEPRWIPVNEKLPGIHKFIILNGAEAWKLFNDEPVNVYVNQIPYVLCTDKYYEDIQDESTDNILKDLSERVENIEKQMKEDKEEQLKKLKAELDYAKFRCTL